MLSPPKRVNVVFCVDLFNEGVDVPEVDTVLFLRPTESALVFLQQLGRGLRRTHGKDCLTVLDFIGGRTAGSGSTCGSARCSAVTAPTSCNRSRKASLDCLPAA